MSARYRQQLDDEISDGWSQDLPSFSRAESDDDPLDEEADDTLMAGKIPEKRRCEAVKRNIF